MNGFPGNPAGLAALTPEERFRYGIFLEGLKEAIGNWHYQCQQDLLDRELCDTGYRTEVMFLLPVLKSMGSNLSNMRRSFIADARKIAEDEGLPVPNEDGTWPRE